MARVTIDLMGKPGCHLCDDARAIVKSVLDEIPETELVEHNILDDAEQFETMKNDIPVVFINGECHATWRVDEAAFRAAVTEALS